MPLLPSRRVTALLKDSVLMSRLLGAGGDAAFTVIVPPAADSADSDDEIDSVDDAVELSAEDEVDNMVSLDSCDENEVVSMSTDDIATPEDIMSAGAVMLVVEVTPLIETVLNVEAMSGAGAPSAAGAEATADVGNDSARHRHWPRIPSVAGYEHVCQKQQYTHNYMARLETGQPPQMQQEKRREILCLRGA